MNQINEVTADNLARVRGAKGLNQDEVAEIIGVPRNSVSKIETGTRALSPSEKAILDWHFFGIVPASVTAKLDLQGVLEFTDDEWHIISLMAKRAGQTPDQWIRESILSFMALRDPTTAAGKADGTHGKTSS